MKNLFRFKALILVWLVFSSVPVLQGQEAKPATPPAQSSAVANNPSVMLLKQGHSDGVRAKAAADLGKEGDIATIPALSAALGDPSVKVRRQVVEALAQFHQLQVLPPLAHATKDMDADVRVLAIQALVSYYTGNPAGGGLTGFMKKNVARVRGHFEIDTTKIDPGITVDPVAITALIDSLKETRSNQAAREAAKGLGILVVASTVPDLVAAAHSSDTDLAREALNALSKIMDRSAGPKLIDLVDSPNKDVKRDACVTVGILRTNAALSKLQSVYESDPDLKDKVAAIQGMAFLGERGSAPLFTKALWNVDKNVRQAASEGLARVADPQSQDELEKVMTVEKDADVKLAIEFALAALGKQDDLNELVNEMDSKARGDVARSYLTELARSPAFLPKLYPYVQSPNVEVRKRLCDVLMYSGDQTSFEPLDRLSHDPSSDVAAQAVRAKRAIRARLDAATTPAHP